MKRLFLFAFLATLVVPTTRLLADEPPDKQIEFVRKLRAKGYADLALQYLDRLAKNPPAGMANLLPLEYARTRVSLARQKEPTQRAALFAAARKDLEAFVKTQGATPEATQARVELARLSAYEGQALLSQAIRLQDDDEKASEQAARKAEAFFLLAGKELEAAAKALKDPLQQLEVNFERGKNFLDQAATHPLNTARARLVGQAKDALEAVEKIALNDNQNPILHLTRAWLIKCYQEGDQPDKAASYVKGVLKEKVAEAAEGQRWAWNFRIRFLLQDKQLTYAVVPLYKKNLFLGIDFPPLAGSKLDNQAKLKRVQIEAKEWLKLFAGYKNSPEGYGVRFALANAYLNEAQLIEAEHLKKKGTKLGNPALLYKAAQEELASLAKSDNDYAEKAAQLELSIRFQQMGEKTPVAKLKDFDECYLKARYEMFKLQQVGAKLAKGGADAAKGLEAERREHLKTAIAAFQRGLRLADPIKDAPQEIEARYGLAYLYQMDGDPYRAAVAGEYLARANPPTKRSATAAIYALQAYEQIARATKQEGDRDRMRDLARYVIEEKRIAWANEPVTAMASSLLAEAYIAEKNWIMALDLLGKVPPNDPAYVYRKAQYVLAASAARKASKDPKEQAAFETQMRAAVQQLPPLPADADVATAQMYMSALVYVEANLLSGEAFEFAVKNETAQANEKYAQLEALHGRLQDLYAKHSRKFPEEAQASFATALREIRNRARYGLAQTAYRAGNYDAVLAPKATGEIVEEVRKLGADGKAIKMSDYRAVGELLGLALRADVQKGKINEARAILDLLRRLTGDGDEAGDSAGNVLQTLIRELRSQLREYKDKKDTVRYDETVKNFSQFLDELTKELGAKSTPEQVAFLAGCYSSLERHAEAAKLFARLPEPKIDPKKKDLTKEEHKELQDYWLTQVNYGRSLRLAKQFPEARKVLSRILTTPHARGQFLAEKEDILMLEDQALYGTAVTRWSKYKSHPTLQQALKTLETADATEQKRINELYYDAGYHYAYCMFMYGKTNKVPATQEKWINRAALEVVRLEAIPAAREAIGARLQELLRSEPLLMAEYTKMKQGKAPAGK